MDDALARWALTLDLDLRRELAKVPGPGWHVFPSRGGVVQERAAIRYDLIGGPSWLPCDPCAVLAHAAGLMGRFYQYRLDGGSGDTLTRVFDPGIDYIDDRGPTPIQAAVAVLAKVVERKKESAT